MGNNKIKEMLASLFTKPEDFRNVCVKHLVNDSCPNNKSHTTFDTLGILADAGDLSVLSYILYVKKQYATNIKEYADELNKDVVAIAEKIKKVKNSNEFVVIVKDIASKAGIKNDEFFSILENNCQEKNFLGYYNAILSSLIVYAVKTENGEDYDKINQRSKVDKGDILMPMIGTIGNPAIVDVEPTFAIKNVALIKFSGQEVKAKYVLFVLNSSLFAKYIEATKRGGTQHFISLKDIRSFNIPCPAVEIQESIIREIEEEISIVEQNKRLIDIFKQKLADRISEVWGE